MRSSRSATKPDQRLIVHVPQLESLLREAGRLPALLAALLDRAEGAPLDTQCPQAELVTGCALPAAPLTRRLDRPDDADGAWLRADPIGLVPDLTAVWLQADESFRSGEWREGVAELLAEEGFSLDLTEGGRGYLRLDTPPDCRFAPPWSLAGASLELCLPAGPGARRWRRLLNETQVMLQQQRKQSDEPGSIPGSLWFWGGGVLPEASSVRPRVTRILADDPVLRGLADWLGLPCRAAAEAVEPEPGSLVEWPSRFEESAEANLERLKGFLGTAWRRLRTGRIRELELAGIERVRRYSVADAWRVWR